MNGGVPCHFVPVLEHHQERALPDLVLLRVLVGRGEGHAQAQHISLLDGLSGLMFFALVDQCAIRSFIADAQVLAQGDVLGVSRRADPYAHCRGRFNFGLGLVEGGLEGLELNVIIALDDGALKNDSGVTKAPVNNPGIRHLQY